MSLVLSLNCSAMILAVITVGIAASKTVIFAIFPLIPNKKVIPNAMIGDKINLYSKETDICGISFCQPLNLSCKPTEKSANGLIVAANLSNKGSAAEKSINGDKTKAKIQPINGGKVKSLFKINFALIVPVLLPPLTAEIIPMVESEKNMV